VTFLNRCKPKNQKKGEKSPHFAKDENEEKTKKQDPLWFSRTVRSVPHSLT
jgi:hypothetical protein